MRSRLTVRVFVAAGFAATVVSAQTPRRALAPGDLDDIAQLLQLEDARQLDEPVLARILLSAHPEVRRRAVVSIARIAGTPTSISKSPEGGRALLVASRGDADPGVVASVAFAAGQLHDPTSVGWLGDVLSSPKSAPAISREAAIALGKIRTPESRAALARYLTETPAAGAPAVGDALLSMGRFTGRGDLAPIVRWITAADANLRWRAAWALYRPRDPAAVPHLLTLSNDVSPEVRFWAMRGLAAPPAPQTGRRGAGGAAAEAPPPPPPPPPPVIPAAQLTARLRAAMGDKDRRVRTEALRALATYDDDQSFAIVVAALDSPDTWLSVSAAEVMAAQRFAPRRSEIGPRLIAAASAKKPLALRIMALRALVTLSPEAAIDLASLLALEKAVVARMDARAALQELGAAGAARLDQLAAADPTLAPSPGGRGGRGQGAQPAAPARPLADYRAIVDRWVVPAYAGAPLPRAIWTTPRGEIEIEINAGDAPIAADYLAQVVESGAIVGTEFGRVVPNFVAQQRTIEGALRLRDEVNRHGLLRGTLSWASSGLDTGRPGYTLGSTPQPHNEGDFTALGRIVRGLDVVDRLELGDAITAARMVPRAK